MAQASRAMPSLRTSRFAALETDKVAVDVPSPVAGVMSEHRVAVGDNVEVGAVIAVIEEGATAAAPAPTPAPAAAKGR